MRSLLTICLVAGMGAVPAFGQRNPYDLILGRLKPKIVEVDELIIQLDLAPDGKSIVYSAAGGPRIVSYPDGNLLRKFPEDTPYTLAAAAFTPDGKRVVAAQPGLRTWEVATGKMLLSVGWDWMDAEPLEVARVDPRWPLTPPVFSPDRGRVYVSAPGDVVTVWDTTTGKELARSGRIGQRVRAMSLSADGKYLGLGFPDGFRVWDAATLKEVFARTLAADGHTGKLDAYRVSFDPKGKKVFVIGASATRLTPSQVIQWVDELQAWDLADKKWLYGVGVRPHGHYDRVLILPGGRYGLVVSSDRTGGDVIEVETGRMLGGIIVTGRCHPLIPAPGGKELVGGAGSAALCLYSVEDIMKLLPQN